MGKQLEDLVSFLDDELLCTPDEIVSERAKKHIRRKLKNLNDMPNEICETCEHWIKSVGFHTIGACAYTGSRFVRNESCSRWEEKEK